MFSLRSSIAAAILALSLASSTSAGPVDQVNNRPTNAAQLVSREVMKRADAPAKNAQSCTASDWYDMMNMGCAEGAIYTVRIGVDYAHGNGCGNVHDALFNELSKNNDGKGIWEWSCTMDTNGYTALSFSTCQDGSSEINDALHGMYPMVNGFNCPDY